MTKELPPWRPSTLAKMTIPELLRLKRALEGSEGLLVDGAIYKCVVDVLWDRAATSVSKWPVTKHEMGYNLISFCIDAVKWTCPKCKQDNWFDPCHCGHPRGYPLLGPDDPWHQPVRRLRPRSRVASSQTLGDFAGDWGAEWYECSCGNRDGDAFGKSHAIGRQWRAENEPGAWLRSNWRIAKKLHLRDANNKPFNPKKPVWLICRYADGLDDREHALNRVYAGSASSRAEFHCICGSSTCDDKAKQIPVDDDEI